MANFTTSLGKTISQEHLGTISRLQEREQDLAKRSDMLTEALEKANSGMESQMQFHWAAEDEVSS